MLPTPSRTVKIIGLYVLGSVAIWFHWLMVNSVDLVAFIKKAERGRVSLGFGILLVVQFIQYVLLVGGIGMILITTYVAFFRRAKDQ